MLIDIFKIYFESYKWKRNKFRMEKIEIMIDVCAKFFSYVRIEGWCAANFKFDCIQDRLINIEISGIKGTYKVKMGLPSPQIGKNLNKNFIVDINLEDEIFPDFHIIFYFKDGFTVKKNINDLRNDRIARYVSLGVMPKFKKMIGDSGKLLDLGGRDRSKLDRSKEFHNEVVVFDVLSGENVDIVGDAHELSSYFTRDYFDAVMSICVFEHLSMPWKVVIEINKILKINGYCLIYTHQTIGLHDSPWDFFRFSEDCWPALFNENTGFEIIDYGSDFEQFIIPFVWHPAKINAEKSAGREASWVIAKKISNTNLNWPVEILDFLSTTYPDTPDGVDPCKNLL